MTVCKRGDVVLVGFVFSDDSGRKLRPALVISSSAYNRGRKEVVVAAITSNMRGRLVGDHQIVDWRGAGLLFPSAATGIIRTVARGIIDRRLGVMGEADMDAIDRELCRSLAL
jgi:mRNA interferase MazF